VSSSSSSAMEVCAVWIPAMTAFAYATRLHNEATQKGKTPSHQVAESRVASHQSPDASTKYEHQTSNESNVNESERRNTSGDERGPSTPGAPEPRPGPPSQIPARFPLPTACLRTPPGRQKDMSHPRLPYLLRAPKAVNGINAQIWYLDLGIATSPCGFSSFASTKI